MQSHTGHTLHYIHVSDIQTTPSLGTAQSFYLPLIPNFLHPKYKEEPASS